ncbi:aspartate/glutamate racemase family protein [Clostridium culturomicium]|uniref:aspartate/glutamate racemase family protein n=1 Tax=Clostridium culturomicium TaxID=1499683 RepID=UPI0038577953
MKTVALIHTVKSVSNTFEEKLRAEIKEDIKVSNLLDDFLSNNANELGEFTIDNRNRLFLDMKTQELTGADVIVTTCSTLTPVVEMIRPFMKIPVIAIDDAMAKMGVTFGKRVLVMATAQSTVEPTKEKLQVEAVRAGVELEIDSLVNHEAFVAIKSLDNKRHDDLLRASASKISGYDCVILAQASMAHMENEISKICKCPVISSPNLCIKEVKEALSKTNK